jgi:integrase
MPWLFKYKGKSDRWWIGYRLNGQQYLRSTGYVERDKAEQELARAKSMVEAHKAKMLTRDLYEHLTGRALANMTFKAALEDWLKEARGATGARTVEKYTLLQTAMTDFFKLTDRGPMLSDITREDLQRYLSDRRSVVSASTTNMARKCLAIFFNRSKACGYLKDSPIEGIPMFKSSREEQHIRRPFTLVELGKLYQQAPDDFWRYMVLAGFFTGLRLGDLATMPIGAVDFREKTINILTRKTGRSLHIPIAAPLYVLLCQLKNERNGASPGEPWWPDQARLYEKHGAGPLSNRFYELVLMPAGLASPRTHQKAKNGRASKHKVNAISFHCFRHSYVSTLAALGQNQQIVKALAGHSSDEVNDLYTKLPPEVLRQAVALLPDITKKEKGQ